MNENLEYVKLEGIGLSEGDTVTVYCPWCRAQHENKLYIFRTEEGIGYKCWRASCPASGFIPDSGIYKQRSGSVRGSKDIKSRGKFARAYAGRLTLAPEELYAHLLEKYSITKDTANRNGFRWAPEESRIYMPVYSRGSVHIGDCLKGHGDYWGTKALIYWFKRDIPLLHFSLDKPSENTAVIVEDILSSIKVSKLLSSVALLGTSIREDQAVEIKKRYDNLIIMLDNDATGIAYKLAKQWRCLFNIEVIPMKQDPKDTNYDELRKLLGV